MPPAILPIAASAALAAGGVAIGAVTVQAAALSVAASFAAAAASSLLREEPSAMDANLAFSGDTAGTSIGQVAGAPINAARDTAVKQSLPPRRFVYGNCRVGGCVLHEGPDEAFGEYYGILTGLSDGVIEAVDGYFIGGEAVAVDGSLNADTTSRYYAHASFEVGLGATTQTTSAFMTSLYPTVATVNFRQRGIARAALKLYWGADVETHNYVFGDGIVPSYLIRGVKVYDPREVSHDVNDPTTWAYSDNPALCVAHAMTNAWHSAIPNTVVDWTTIASAADDCDTIDFHLAGIVQSDTSLAAQVADMLRSFGGWLTYSDGLYKLYVDKARSAVATVTDADMLALTDIQFEPDAAARFDKIKAVYYDAAGDGARMTSPIITIGAGARETSLDLPFTSDSRTAQILAFRKLTYDRDGGSISLILHDAWLALIPSDVFAINSTVFPFANGNWQVLQIDVAEVGCIVTARRYVSGAYVDPATYVV